ncbi:MAG: type 4a pilus biogenesis protein PilO [Candidatus Marinimicrobia bacterium]|jgi:Tfp pilus assembly protein PilO|nr:type 4a pilus biogenesis protein PilO [Candidatus Neomarinimicrobiota bacterium]MBT3501133.1 type 4a pilus biogenesis protein PilO [Candidatus Neomarinimicrobiota bacterium]MBT3840433.1 type 4a pilus biogenesis protein PilO [Candidatus Neomarinimicrobiota bacterium]MBT3999999.1 type 4a pilus biogenesis protein PilO [Candidatus Neomarinimicrobiota bacterium]MBT4282370.1 type 4a pilus biogenesis protein PilO [Candidatus Neomarinimicrobiota bacterium]
MTEFLKNQKNAFFALMGTTLVVAMVWYFALHKKVQSSYNENRAQYLVIKNNRDLYRKMKKRLPSVETELETLNSAFQETLNKITTKANYDNAANALYELFMKRGFDVKIFSPSKIPLEKKKIKLSNSDNIISVGKYPIDIQINGDFIQLGELLDDVKNLPYRITINNIQIENGSPNSIQSIKLIAYLYLQSEQKILNSSKTTDSKSIQSKSKLPKPTSSTPSLPKSNDMGMNINNPFQNMTLGKANYKAKTLGLEYFWWKNSEGVYLNDLTRTNGLGDYIESNSTGKVTVYN